MEGAFSSRLFFVVVLLITARGLMTYSVVLKIFQKVAACDIIMTS